MATGVELALLATSLAATAAGTYASMTAATKNAEAQAKANNQNASMLIADAQRQQGEVAKQAAVEKSDRAQAADRERATLMALSAERGALGSTLVDRLVGQSLHFENEDLGRIDLNAQKQIDALQSEKVAVSEAAKSGNLVAGNRARTERTSSLLGGVGSSDCRT